MGSGVPSGWRKTQLVVGAGDLAVLQLGLGDRRAHVDVPEGGRLGAIGEVPADKPQEPALRRARRLGPDRRVGVLPVDRQAHVRPEVVVLGLELGHDLLAQLDEVRPAHRDRPRLRVDLLGALEARVVGEGGVDDGAGDELDPTLHVEPVVVPPHGVEDLLAPHALVAGDEVGVGVAEDVPGVQGAAHRGRRRVDGEHLGACLRAVEAVGAVAGPRGAPLRLEPLQRGLVRDRRHCVATGLRPGPIAAGRAGARAAGPARSLTLAHGPQGSGAPDWSRSQYVTHAMTVVSPLGLRSSNGGCSS